MNFNVTPAQWRVLKYFWRTQQPFTLEKLLAERVLHLYPLAHFCLYRMLVKHQIIPFAVTAKRAIQFVGTTKSRDDWAALKQRPTTMELRMVDPYFLSIWRLNPYEQEEIFAELERLLKEKKGRSHR